MKYLSGQPVRGYVFLFALVIGAIFFTITTALTGQVVSDVRLQRQTRGNIDALALAEAGIDKAIYELNQSPSYAGEVDTALGNGTFTTQVTAVDSATKRVTSTGYIPSSANPVAERTVTVTVSVDTTLVSFRYGIQVGNGGLIMDINSTVQGNIYANGPISGGGTVTGDATAAGTSTISGITAQGNATAHSLSSCTVGKNAYYQTDTTNCSVAGTKNPGTPDSPAFPMPISDAQIAEWEALAENGGVIAGPYNLTGDQTLGPIKIDGDLTVANNAKLRMAGPIWVKGDVSFGNGSHFLIAPSVSGSVVLIADVPGQTSTKGTFDLSNNITIAGNGSANSFPMAISTKVGASAITMNNNATSVLLYAPYGTISIGNNASANQITAHTLHLQENATIVYVSGLQNTNFTNGPGGSWAVNPGSYVIVP